MYAPDGFVKQQGAERCICGTVGRATLHRPPTALQPEAEMHRTSVSYQTALACGHADPNLTSVTISVDKLRRFKQSNQFTSSRNNPTTQQRVLSK